jgi:hypothetical protein
MGKRESEPIPTLLDMSGEGTATPSVPAPASTRGRGTRVKGGADASIQWARERAAEAATRRQQQQEATVLQQVLPLWSDEYRGVPNPMLRSGLFGTKTSGTRSYLKGEQIVSLSNFSIHYKGEELLQDDLSVWMAMINMAREKRIGDRVFFTGYELVKDLGWRMHSDSYRRCKDSISRLKANELKIQVKTATGGYAGSLIREYAWDASSPDGDTKWMVRFEPMIEVLFRDDNVTFVEWEQRKMIGTRATLTLWMHGYYMSHRDPHPISVQKLHELSKSEEKHMKSFKVRVRKALERLVEIGCLSSYHINGDLVHVVKAPVRVANLKDAATKRLLPA